MNRVGAKRITYVVSWMCDTLGGSEGGKVSYNVEGERYSVAPTIAGVDLAVGDWLVQWDNGMITGVTDKTFKEHYHHVEGNIYETNFTPLFKPCKLKPEVGCLHDGYA